MVAQVQQVETNGASRDRLKSSCRAHPISTQIYEGFVTSNGSTVILSSASADEAPHAKDLGWKLLQGAPLLRARPEKSN